MEELDKPKKGIDWTLIEKDYRAGIRALRSIASDHGITETAIRKHAKKYSWTRDLGARIAAKTEELVRKDEVRKKVWKETEQDIIDANAEMQANIIRSHRKDITRYRGLCESLLHELELQTGHLVTFEQLNDLMQESGNDAIDKLTETYKRVIATPSRVDSVKKLSDTLKVLIGLERQAFGIADNANGDANKNSLEDLLLDIK
jgi:predicted transcriptional regulator